MKLQTIVPLPKVKPNVFIRSKKGMGKIVSLPGLDNNVLEIEGDLGVDNIKAAFKVILEIGEDFVQLAQNFSIQAALPVVFKLASFQTYIPVFKKSLEEYRAGISPEEAKEIGDDLKINFDLKNNSLEEAIERVIDLMPSTYMYLYDTIVNGIALYGGWKTTVMDLRSLFRKEEAVAA